jgi:hypothetical protein
MRRAKRESLARAKRVARVAQRAVDVLGTIWKVPVAWRLLRRLAIRQRKKPSAGSAALADEAALAEWLWKKNGALGNVGPPRCSTRRAAPQSDLRAGLSSARVSSTKV